MSKSCTGLAFELVKCLSESPCMKVGALDKLEAFASFNGPDFYRLPRNTSTVTLEKVPVNIPTEYSFGSGTVVPICAGETLEWSVSSTNKF
ncbi:hypothetical protein R1sor_022058 [Riccia sorocarpa]|uniref:Uncharacterized protein n=1 Tax=Riccia sorocarpa TaxID=122646 RepID=A0ABD3GLS1_9MARC